MKFNQFDNYLLELKNGTQMYCGVKAIYPDYIHVQRQTTPSNKIWLCWEMRDIDIKDIKSVEVV